MTVMEDMLKDFLLGEHLLLVGNQVGNMWTLFPLCPKHLGLWGKNRLLVPERNSCLLIYKQTEEGRTIVFSSCIISTHIQCVISLRGAKLEKKITARCSCPVTHVMFLIIC